MCNVGDSSYIGAARENDTNLRLSEPWKDFSTSNFSQNEFAKYDDYNNAKVVDDEYNSLKYDNNNAKVVNDIEPSIKLQDNSTKKENSELFPNDFEDEEYYSDSSSEVEVVQTKEFEYQYFYLFGFLLLVLSIGFLYWENCILDVPQSEELNLTVAYVLEKKF